MSHTRTYKVLHEVYQGVCTDYHIDGKSLEKGHQISMERGFLAGIGYFEGKYGDNTYLSVSRLVKDISCACRCINNSTWSNSGVARRR
jgi:hypothetical protein